MQLFIQISDSIDDTTTLFANLRERIAGEAAIANYRIAWAKTQEFAFLTAAIALITFSYICLAASYIFKTCQTIADLYQRIKPHAITFAQAIAAELRQLPPAKPQLEPASVADPIIATPIKAKTSAKPRRSTAKTA
jgi:hypothetical protein